MAAKLTGCLFCICKSFVLPYKVCMKRAHFFLPEPTFERLQTLSKKLDVSVSELIRRAVEDFMKKQK